MRLLLLAAGLAAFAAPLRAQPYAPAADRVDLMDVRFYPARGGFLFSSATLFFPPAGASSAELVVTDASGATVASHDLRVEPIEGGGAFAGLRATASFDIAREGDFALEVRVGGETVTRVPFSLAARASGDPFDPATEWVREGPWRTLGYLAQPHGDLDDPLAFAFWASTRELPGGGDRANLSLSLRRDGQEVAATKGDAVLVNGAWTGYRRELFTPDGRDRFRLSDLQAADGAYALVVLADGEPLKTYRYRVESGAVVPHARSVLPASPQPDFLPPSRLNTSAGSSSRYFREDVFWSEAE